MWTDIRASGLWKKTIKASIGIQSYQPEAVQGKFMSIFITCLLLVLVPFSFIRFHMVRNFDWIYIPYEARMYMHMSSATSLKGERSTFSKLMFSVEEDRFTRSATCPVKFWNIPPLFFMRFVNYMYFFCVCTGKGVFVTERSWGSICYRKELIRANNWVMVCGLKIPCFSFLLLFQLWRATSPY